MRRVVWLLVLIMAGCGSGQTTQAGEEAQVDDAAVTQRAEEVVAGVLDATAPDREQTPSEGSGQLGPPCDPDGPVSRSRFVGATAPLEEADDAAAIVTDAADWFASQGLEVADVRTEAPQQGAYAHDDAGGTYSLRILEAAGTIAASANTPCIPQEAGEPTGERTADLADLLAETADAIAAGAPSAEISRGCPGGTAIQRSLDLEDAAGAAAAFDRLVEHWGAMGPVTRATGADGAEEVRLERDDAVFGGILLPGTSTLILAAERGCEED